MRSADIKKKLIVSRGEGNGGWAKWMKVSGRYRTLVIEQVSHGNKRHSIGNILSGIIITLYGDGATLKVCIA